MCYVLYLQGNVEGFVPDTDWRIGGVPDFYSRGIHFESRPGHRLFWIYPFVQADFV
jgi:hypothetical protein